MSMFYAEVCIKEFGIEGEHVWIHFMPLSTSSIPYRASEGFVTYDIVFRSESSPEQTPEPAYICHKDTCFGLTEKAKKKILAEPALLLCKQQRLKMTIGIEIYNNGQAKTSKIKVKGAEKDCIQIKSVEFK